MEEKIKQIVDIGNGIITTQHYVGNRMYKASKMELSEEQRVLLKQAKNLLSEANEYWNELLFCSPIFFIELCKRAMRKLNTREKWLVSTMLGFRRARERFQWRNGTHSLYVSVSKTFSSSEARLLLTKFSQKIVRKSQVDEPEFQEIMEEFVKFWKQRKSI